MERKTETYRVRRDEDVRRGEKQARKMQTKEKVEGDRKKDIEG